MILCKTLILKVFLRNTYIYDTFQLIFLTFLLALLEPEDENNRFYHEWDFRQYLPITMVRVPD